MKISSKKLLEKIANKNTYIDEFGLVAGAEVVQHAGLVEVGQVGHVLTLLVLGRVHLWDN